MGLLDVARKLLGVSAYAPKPPNLPSLGDPEIDARRAAFGGNLTGLPTTKLRWYLKELEIAIALADAGDASLAAQLYRAMRRDGVFSGLLETRASGLLRLPRAFSGHEEAREALSSQNGARSVFDEMVPPSESQAMIEDGILLGIAVGELVPVIGRDYPVLVRLEPEFLMFRWNEGRWYFRSTTGLLPITPGDGKWVLHIPKARMSPWQFGQWMACGEAWINKSHALLYRGNYGSRLAHPARVVMSPHGATEEQTQGYIQRIAAWGINTVFALKPGWEAKILEVTGGRGTEVWKADEASADQRFMMSLAGQVVTSTGGSGFISGDLFKSIRSDLIETDGDAWAYTCNTQILPAFVLERWGEAALEQGSLVHWDTRPPKDRQAEAQVLVTIASAIELLGAALAGVGFELDVREIAVRFGIPFREMQNPDAARAGGVVDLAAVRMAAKVAVEAGWKPTAESVVALLQAARLPVAA